MITATCANGHTVAIWQDDNGKVVGLPGTEQVTPLPPEVEPIEVGCAACRETAMECARKAGWLP